jgi:formate dehydrogenase iron-sulfur subunit
MTMNNASIYERRRFLKFLLSIPAISAFGGDSSAQADTVRYGKLVDTTKCIGCKRCMSACKRWNKLKVDRMETVTDRKTELSAHNYTVVNLRIDANNREHRFYTKWQCQHCIKPACAGACPVSAITKHPKGPVVINGKKCIGCRYCYQSCPYKVPQFDFEKRITRKCTLCYDKVPLRLVKPACVAACPVGALSFGYKDEMILKAKKRIYKRADARYILGLKEAGGTDVLTILPAPPRDVGLIVAQNKVMNQNIDKIRITASGIMGASFLAGLMYIYSTMTQDLDKWSNDNQD